MLSLNKHETKYLYPPHDMTDTNILIFSLTKTFYTDIPGGPCISRPFGGRNRSSDRDLCKDCDTHCDCSCDCDRGCGRGDGMMGIAVRAAVWAPSGDSVWSEVGLM